MGKLLEMKVNPVRLSGQLFNQALEWEPVNVEHAEYLYQRAIEVYRYNVGALVNLGTIIFNRSNFERAEELYRQAIAVNSNYALAYFNLANLLDTTWRRRDALVHYRRALEIDPDYADAHYNLASTLHDLGRPMEAAKHWLAFLRLEPYGDFAETAKKNFSAIADKLTVQKNTNPEVPHDGKFGAVVGENDGGDLV